MRMMAELMQKPLPVGVDRFEKIIQSGFYYLDKTDFIQQLLASTGEVNLFTRPRRFGKTLMMSMLKAFFEIGSDPKLFAGLKAAENHELCAKHQGRYPVIFLSLKSIGGKTYAEALRRLAELLSVEAQRLSYLLSSEKVPLKDKERLMRLIDADTDEILLQFSLPAIMRMLHAHHEKPVILLIDEYDVPLDKSSQSGYYDSMVEFLRTFIGVAFKTKPDLYFAVVTGCLRISKESIFTGVNNLKADGISDKRFDEFFGFTDTDVRKILADYGLSHAYPQMREWYDGYRFGDTSVYCPWDVVNHCDKLLADPEAQPQAYWNNTSSNDLVKRFIDKADGTTRSDIERLIAGETIEHRLVENLTYAELDERIDHLWSVLYLTGYLTLDQHRKPAHPGFACFVIPNREVREIFIEKIQKWFEEKVENSAETLRTLYQALENGAAEEAERIIRLQLRTTISYYDQYEGFYHGFLLGLLKGNPEWIVLSNREAGMGRSDIQIEREDLETGIIIEIKHAGKEASLDKISGQALAQITAKGYADSLVDDVETIWGYGITFAEKRCCVRARRLK